MWSKFNLLMSMLAVVSFLLSLWLIPAGLVIAAFVAIKTLWIKILLCTLAAIWLLLIHPWTMFKNPRWPQFVKDMQRAILTLFS